jgi:hypothetical protein
VVRPATTTTRTTVTAEGHRDTEEGGSGINARMPGGGFYSASSESQHAAALLEQRFHVGKPNLVVLATATGGRSVDDPAVVVAGQALTQELAATRGITAIDSYWGPAKSELLRSNDGTKALIVGHVEGNEREFAAAAERLVAGYRGTERGPLKLELGGEAVRCRCCDANSGSRWRNTDLVPPHTPSRISAEIGVFQRPSPTVR